MAGGGAAASAFSSPWRALLQRALDANAHLRHSTYFQLATVGAGGRPANRTVVFRGFQEHCDKIQINTDVRSNKIGEIRNCPFGEICWYFTESWEQFRVSGSIDVIDGSSADPAKLEHREKAWFASSVKSRLQYLGPQPGIPVLDDEKVTDVHLDPSSGPVDNFCLLVLDPEKVDYLNLKSNQRLMFIRSEKKDGSSDWMAEKRSTVGRLEFRSAEQAMNAAVEIRTWLLLPCKAKADTSHDLLVAAAAVANECSPQLLIINSLR